MYRLSRIIPKFISLISLASVLSLVSAVSAVGQTAPTFDDVFSKKFGNLRMSASNFDLGRIDNNANVYDTILIFNSGAEAMTIHLPTEIPPFIKLKINGSPLQPDEQGSITLIYDPAKKNDYGFVMDRIKLNTNDSLMPEKYITISATIHDYFPASSDSDSLRIKTRIPEGFLSFGKVIQGDKMTHDFKIYNDGSRPLIIHKYKTTCPCVKATLSKTEIGAGDSATIHAEYDSSGKYGKVSMVVYLFTNDPAMPEAKFEMLGEVVQ